MTPFFAVVVLIGRKEKRLLMMMKDANKDFFNSLESNGNKIR